jgi:hypothetical protein
LDLDLDLEAEGVLLLEEDLLFVAVVVGATMRLVEAVGVLEGYLLLLGVLETTLLRLTDFDGEGTLLTEAVEIEATTVLLEIEAEGVGGLCSHLELLAMTLQKDQTPESGRWLLKRKRIFRGEVRLTEIDSLWGLRKSLGKRVFRNTQSSPSAL